MNTLQRIKSKGNTQKLDLFVKFLQKSKSFILMTKKNDFFSKKYTFQTKNG